MALISSASPTKEKVASPNMRELRESDGRGGAPLHDLRNHPQSSPIYYNRGKTTLPLPPTKSTAAGGNLQYGSIAPQVRNEAVIEFKDLYLTCCQLSPSTWPWVLEISRAPLPELMCPFMRFCCCCCCLSSTIRGCDYSIVIKVSTYRLCMF